MQHTHWFSYKVITHSAWRNSYRNASPAVHKPGLKGVPIPDEIGSFNQECSFVFWGGAKHLRKKKQYVFPANFRVSGFNLFQFWKLVDALLMCSRWIVQLIGTFHALSRPVSLVLRIWAHLYGSLRITWCPWDKSLVSGYGVVKKPAVPQQKISDYKAEGYLTVPTLASIRMHARHAFVPLPHDISR